MFISDVLVTNNTKNKHLQNAKEIVMPASYSATTGVESFAGDAFAFELSDLRVAERLPSSFPPGAPTDVFVEPQPLTPEPSPPGKSSRRPSNIIPLKDYPLFYLGVDVTFLGTELGEPGYPTKVDLEVRFFLEGKGIAQQGTPERHEINIKPQYFRDLTSDPSAGPLRHQLWVQVARDKLSDIIEAPTGETWDELFTPGTIFEVSAAVRVDKCKMKPLDCPCIVSYISGADMFTYDCPKPDPDLPVV
jgi:hypothetical protein